MKALEALPSQGRGMVYFSKLHTSWEIVLEMVTVTGNVIISKWMLLYVSY